MEEPIWIYFGVIVIILTVVIITSVFISYEAENNEQLLFDGLSHLAAQADIVCKSPKDTMLSVPITLTAGSRIYAETDKICASYEGEVRCRPSCTAEPGTVIDLTANETKELFRSRTYTCSVLRGDSIVFNCSG
jgi:hypothetical protein